MPARNPDVAEHTQGVLTGLGRELRHRRQALGLTAVTTAEAAGMSRVTLHRIEAGSPAVTIGAYMNAAAALGLELKLDEPRQAQPEPPAAAARRAAPQTVRVGDFPQLQAIAWQLRAETELTGAEALQLYERNWRHVDQGAMSEAERELVQQLANTHSKGVLLV
ncbi:MULTISPECIES: helix-turn-helix domain-containing protein [Mycolicibacter]|uniref:Helix-turn-helix domain-containing protein n=2 Tax=Mycolicibacter TaxID=1073531 RepID=A0ABU5XLA3_9MYCO|nr:MULTISPECIES: helix-turn-helix domain-containing protein [unclassified Mycolicibacter]MEB3023065.1 helix-turn-helix domain-containing protein [Mycolicibacter sp. MYC098]MEB3033575.1 helix-turn-helix domain-containing protein [Mycolicibacter sp. MYC340]